MNDLRDMLLCQLTQVCNEVTLVLLLLRRGLGFDGGMNKTERNGTRDTTRKATRETRERTRRSVRLLLRVFLTNGHLANGSSVETGVGDSHVACQVGVAEAGQSQSAVFVCCHDRSVVIAIGSSPCSCDNADHDDDGDDDDAAADDDNSNNVLFLWLPAMKATC
jgi:hypothetical protein